MTRKSPDRRNVLQSLAGGVTALTLGTGTVCGMEEKNGGPKYKSNNREPISDEKAKELREKYYGLDVRKQRGVFNRHATRLLQLFSSPVSDNEVLTKRVADRYVESDWRIIQKNSISAFPVNHGMASMGWGKWDGTPSASLRTHKWMKDFELTLTVQPEINRAYMTVDHRIDSEGGDEHFVIEEQDNQIVASSACIKDSACKEDSVHVEGCAASPGCYTTELYCCPENDNCYWGNVSSNLCGDTCCSGCRYHCFGGSCY